MKERKKTQKRKKQILEAVIAAGIIVALLLTVCDELLQEQRQMRQALAAGGDLETGYGDAASSSIPEETECESETESESESEAESETESEPESAAESETESEPESEAESELESEAESPEQNQTQPQSEMRPQEEPQDSDDMTVCPSPAPKPEPILPDAQEDQTEEESVMDPQQTDSEAGEAGQTRPGDEADDDMQAQDGGQETQPQSDPPEQMQEEPESAQELETHKEPESVQELETQEEPESVQESEPQEESESVQELETHKEPESMQEETGSVQEPGAQEEPESVQESEMQEEPQTEKKETQRKPRKIIRGKHYHIRGEDGAWYRDEADRLWVRAGSSLCVETKSGSGYDQAQGLENLEQDGVFTFCLKKTDASGKVLEESEIKQERYFVDGEAPLADIAVQGERLDGIVYTAKEAQAVITVAPDGKSGLRSAAYLVLPCEEDGSLLQDPSREKWTTCDENSSVAIQEEGLFQVFVRTEDQVGNTEFSKSRIICVDHTPPRIQIKGVQDQTANAGEVKLVVTGTDEHYKLGTLRIELEGKNTGKAPEVCRKKETAQGAVTEFFDFPKQRAYDDVYRLLVRAEDLSGNIIEESMEFSVNRCGSVYDLSRETQQALKKYFLSRPAAVTFYETNIDYIGESQIYCRRDGELQRLEREKDYFVDMEGSRDSWKRYCYTIPEAYFRQEGIYELLLVSVDRANNKADTGMQKKQVAFVLDWTAPECVITGIEEQGIYEDGTVTACLTPHDKMGLKQMRVYHNSRLLLEKNEFHEGDATVRIPLEQDGQWQTVQVFLEDQSGNTYWSREIPVFVGSGAREVPQYRKVRASARETEQKKKKDLRRRMAGLPDIRSIHRMERQEAGSDRELPLLRQTSVSGRQQLGRLEGTALLILGVVMFALTLLSCILAPWKRKNRPK